MGEKENWKEKRSGTHEKILLSKTGEKTGKKFYLSRYALCPQLLWTRSSLSSSLICSVVTIVFSLSICVALQCALGNDDALALDFHCVRKNGKFSVFIEKESLWRRQKVRERVCVSEWGAQGIIYIYILYLFIVTYNGYIR